MAQTRKKKVLEEVRKQRQRRRAVTITIIAVVLIAVIAGGVYAFLRSSGNANTNFPFPCLPQEQLFLHIHPWPRIVINNGPSNISVIIPAGVGILGPQTTNGIVYGGSCFEPLHTHDTSGIIHVESPSTSTQYTLDNFFQIWKVTYNTVNVNGVNQPVVFNSTDILGYSLDQTHRVWLIVDGNNSTDYGSLVLNGLDYCSTTRASVPPCNPTAGGDPFYGGQLYPYGAGHGIIIYYKTL